MHHPTPPLVNLLFLLLIPLLIWLRLRRARRAAAAADYWFEPEGDHFIYHPFGRFGAAHLVSPALRTTINAKTAGFTRVVGLTFVAIAAGPIVLRSIDPATYIHYLPIILKARIAALVLLLLGGLLWRLAVLRPLYRNTPLAPRRIALQTVRAKQAAGRSWWSIALSIILLSSLASFLLLAAYKAHSIIYLIYGLVLTFIAVRAMLAGVTKLRHRAT